ncbi:hypothetical protein [Candidatus Protochlamydia amoebophila]|uniref:Uncharacterized protein n=1 Tax=Protochlamydia amoebophila (strain UWE25) TaxID=264201 RepID=Q6MCP9_PARUW|nr:hypothetical protein [Candidatus Protochlamydia amoebophila]CAF23650.1 unnamed protein product [Candidatus Protochlamydia amoebophila UWE25]
MSINFETIKNQAVDYCKHFSKQAGQVAGSTKNYGIKFFKGANEFFKKIFNIFQENIEKGLRIARKYAEKNLKVLKEYTVKGLNIAKSLSAKGLNLARKSPAIIQDKTRKIVAFSSAKLHNPHYACPVVVITNIILLQIVFKAVDLLYDKVQETCIREENLTKDQKDKKDLAFLALAIASLVGLHTTFKRILKPNISVSKYALICIATSCAQIGFQLLRAEFRQS